MYLAVAGDVHGHLALLYAILGRWQRESGRSFDLILQVGDLGAFASGSELDRATQRHARTDPEEMGFRDFARPEPPRTLLDPRPPLVFIPGNHEDFDFLARHEARAGASPVYPITPDGKIQALRSGRVWEFRKGARIVRIAGVSGVDGRALKKSVHPRVHLQEEEALRLAARAPGTIDLFISHERPAGITGRFRHDLGGSEALALLLDAVKPPLAFFGHYDRQGEFSLGGTRVFGLAGCGYERKGEGPVKRGGIAIVDWTAPDPVVELLEPEWLRGVRLGEWRRWG